MAEEIINKFHNLEGTSIGERQKNLSNLLRTTTIRPEEKQSVLEKIVPQTYLENLFYIDILIHFKEASRLLQIFIEGNGPFVSKFVKLPWFFQDAFKEVDPKFLVDDMLPLLSFSMKAKLVKNLKHIYNEEKIDEVFDYATDTYGLNFAVMFITSCSPTKISSILKENKVTLSTHQLKVMYTKQPSLIQIYLKEQSQYHKKEIFDNHFLTFLAQKDPNYFWKLMENGDRKKNNLKLGRRTTKKLLRVRKDSIVNDPKKYIVYLRHETLVRKLYKQGIFHKLYENLFPRNVEFVQNKRELCKLLLKYYPKKGRYNLFTKTFMNVMNVDICHYTSCMSDDLLYFITDEKVQQYWAWLKFKESSNVEYLKLYEIEKAIEIIKEKIDMTSAIKSRAKLVSLLVKSCAVHKDLKSLVDILNYFCTRHKNDDKTTRSEFLLAIEKNFDLKTLGKKHWKYINEIFSIQRINNERAAHNCKLRIRHIEYLFNNGYSEQEKTYSILEYVKEQLVSFDLTFETLQELKNAEIKKAILLLAMENLDMLITNQNREDSKIYLISNILARIFSFNINYPENAICVEEHAVIVDALKLIMKERGFVSYEFQKNFAHMLCKLERSAFEDELLKFYMGCKSVREITLEKTLHWCLKYDPMVLINNFDELTRDWSPRKRRLWDIIKKYSHIKLDDRIVEFCFNQVQTMKEEHVSSYIVPLSILKESGAYIKIMEDLNFIPTTTKILVHNTEMNKHYEVQKLFLKNFKNNSDPLKYLPLLLHKFCHGDYLQTSLTPLYSAFHRSSEKDLESFLDRLIENNSMSVKKHALVLACCVFKQQMVLKICNIIETDKNDSLQKRLCLTTLRYFSKSPSQELFEKVLVYRNMLKEYDTESLKILTTIQVPKNYRIIFTLQIWGLLKTLNDKVNIVEINLLMSTLLENIDTEFIAHMPRDFCKVIIINHFMKNVEPEEEIQSINKFVVQFLLQPKNEVENFGYVFELVSNYKLQYWDLKGMERKTIFKFFKAFYTEAVKKDMTTEIVMRFSRQWENIFSINDTLEQHILLNLLRFKTESEPNFLAYSARIVVFAEEVNAQYGEFVFTKFIQVLANFFFTVYKEEQLLKLLTYMLRETTSVTNCILIMEIISAKGDLFYKSTIRPMYREIDSMLREVKDPKVQLCYNLYSKNES